MKCSKCHSENPDAFRFCSDCGTQLLKKPSPQPSPADDETIDTDTGTLEIPSEKLPTGSTFDGRYQIIEELGIGAMGKVYKVLDKEIDMKVALKLIRPEIAAEEHVIARFRNELKIARDISHKNVCRMYDLNKMHGNYYITMEYVPGEDLKNMLRMTKHLSVGAVINLTKQVCEGLAEAHRLGVVHRDLKPSNIMIDREGNARIMDFGLARYLKSRGKTGAGIMIGTPQYMSPEQVDGERVDNRSDIYSLGVILFEILTGRLPFEGDTPLDIAMMQKTKPPPKLKEINAQIPEDFNGIVQRCLEKDKEKRYQRVEELLAEIVKIEKSIPITEKDLALKKPKKDKIVSKKWKNALLYGAVPIIFILLVFGGIYFSNLNRETLESIAVLPFEIVNADPDTEYLSDGITERIIGRLTQLPSLKKVIARSSVFRYKGKEMDPRAIGQELGVDAILVSRMSRRDDDLSISVELIKVRDNSRIWGRRYTRKISEIFAIQEEITNSITDNLRLRLTGEERERMARRYTDNSEAFVAYSKGRYFWSKRTEEDLRRAIEYFDQALKLDPNYALAYYGLSHAYLLIPEYGDYLPREAYSKAREAAQRALEIDNELAEARISLAQIKRRMDWDWDGAIREYERAIELDPGNATAHHWYGYDLMCLTRFEEAVQKIRRAHELDPKSLVINRNLGQVLYRAGRHDEAIEVLERTLEMDPLFSHIHFYMGLVYLEKSMYDEALAELEKEEEIARGWELGIKHWIGITYMKMDQKEKTREILDELIEISQQRYVPATGLAMLCFALEDDDQGFQFLEMAYEQFDSGIGKIKTEFPYDRVRSDPRFKALLKKIGLGN